MFPIFLKLQGRPCLVVGGGPIAARKIESLLEQGAKVTVIATEFSAALDKLAPHPDLMLHERSYKVGDVQGFLLVICAVGAADVTQQVQQDATSAACLFNAVDQPELCDFYVPSVVQRGPLQIAISTGGKCPALAAHLRRTLQQSYPERYAEATEAMGRIRDQLRETVASEQERGMILEALLASGALERFAAGDDHAFTLGPDGTP